jgi:hypothetical protein
LPAVFVRPFSPKLVFFESSQFEQHFDVCLSSTLYIAPVFEILGDSQMYFVIASVGHQFEEQITFVECVAVGG